jgi:hypothetical protein
MKLPNSSCLIIEREKIVDYLLNPTHRYGASKARFFTRFGFRIEQWEQLLEALREHGCAHEISMTYETGFGPRYVVEGEMRTPDSRRPHIRTVWQMDKGAVAPRLISAYPLEAL